MTDCDILVVGAGSAGCVVASELVRQSGLRVIVLEPDSGEANRVDRQRPANWLRLFGSPDDWGYRSSPSSHLAGRALPCPRGRGLGGSGRINAMIWFPPTAADLLDLSQQGGHRWPLNDLQASLDAVESLVRPERPRWISQAAERFMETVGDWVAAEPQVYRRVNRLGRRWNASELLHRAAAVRPDQLRIVRATAQRLLFEGDRVSGVEVEDGPTADKIRAAKGVVLCAGAIATPDLLMRSGIGPKDTLRASGIDSRVDSPRIGADLQDHLIMPVVFRLPTTARFPMHPSTRELAVWQSTGGGPVSCNIAECGGLFENDRFQIHVTPTDYLRYPSPSAPAAMTLAVNVTKPRSRGRVTVVTGKSGTGLRIEPGYLSDSEDLRSTIEGVHLCRRIAATGRLEGWQTGEQLPGARRESDEGIGKAIARYALPLYHPVGTCAMGRGSESPVTETLQVRGVDRLQVIDGSVLPSVTTGNPQATIMTLAHFGSRILLDH